MLVENAISLKNREYKESEKRAKRLIDKVRKFIYCELMESLSKYDGVKLTQLTRLYDEFDELFKKVFDINKVKDYQSALRIFSDFIKQRIINLFCFGSSSEVYKDVIRIIALFSKQHGIL